MNKMITQESKENTEILEAIMTVSFPKVKDGYQIPEVWRMPSLNRKLYYTKVHVSQCTMEFLASKKILKEAKQNKNFIYKRGKRIIKFMPPP